MVVVELSPEHGEMSALLYESDNVELPMALFLAITIELNEFEFRGEIEETSIQLDFIAVHFESFSDLENRAFEFPCNPETGYIDGSIYLDGQHVPVDVTKIRFHSFDGDNVKAEFHGKVLFDYCGYEEPNQGFEMSVSMTFDNLFIPPDIVSPTIANFDRAKNLLNKFFNLDDLSVPTIENNGFCDAIVFHKAI